MHKALLRLALALIVSAPFAATGEIDVGCNGASSSLDVRVHGVRSEHGYVTFVLYGDNPDDFLARGKKLLKKRFPAKTGTVEFCLPVPRPGIYAAAAYHDENGNLKFDKNWIGLPKEGFGVSNSPKMFLVPPSHEEAAFRTTEGMTEIDIVLEY